ncbi:nitroreductase family protein [Cytobacillus gottheilii]|uniref:nitroreductase family protein n=1 Tax=Cytobacillus gottheilii TaxID=859144 RepID=UPI0009BA6F22|nr:nitroreductase family protein [Cytobacillus gottheilii]
MSHFMDVLKGRRSIRKYDPEVKISREEMEEILTEASLAPSSLNLQPWRFLVIESPEAKAKLAPLAKFNQSQVQTSSAVIAVFADLESHTYAEEIFTKSVELGIMPEEVKERQIQSISKIYSTLPEQINKELTLVDSGLVSMQLMLAAKAHGYDTNPIGGFEKDQIAEAFDMDKDRYVPIMLISIGKADEEGYQSYRLPVDTIAQWK